MKAVLALLLALALGFGAGWLVHTRPHVQELRRMTVSESDLQNKNAYLEQSLADARKNRPEVRTLIKPVTTTVTNRLAPTEIIEKLTQLNPNGGDESRNRILRRIVFHLEMLAELGPAAIPAIHDFLKQNKDVDYTTDLVTASGQRDSRR